MWATASDVTDSWIGDDAPTDTAKLELWVGRAGRLVRRTVSDLQSRIGAEAETAPPSTELADTARDVVVAMVTRVFRNPEGVRQQQTGTGPFTGSVTYGGEQPGGLVITDDELAQLRGKRPGQAFGIDTLGLGSGVIVHAASCAINFGADYCSCGAILTQAYPLWGG